MKKVYLPTTGELYQMQEMGADVYKYILVKAIESLICYGVNYPNAKILKNAYKYLQEDVEISKAICLLYPDELKYSSTARANIDLCSKLIETRKIEFCGLDYLSCFDSGVHDNTMILSKVILLLNDELKRNPKYRFEYKSDNELFDRIFNREISGKEIMFFFEKIKYNITEALIQIEPTYALSLPDNCFAKTNNIDKLRMNYLYTGINSYANRYGISNSVGFDYAGVDILTNPDVNVKRLMRCIKDRNK